MPGTTTFENSRHSRRPPGRSTLRPGEVGAGVAGRVAGRGSGQGERGMRGKRRRHRTEARPPQSCHSSVGSNIDAAPGAPGMCKKWGSRADDNLYGACGLAPAQFRCDLGRSEFLFCWCRDALVRGRRPWFPLRIDIDAQRPELVLPVYGLQSQRSIQQFE